MLLLNCVRESKPCLYSKITPSSVALKTPQNCISLNKAKRVLYRAILSRNNLVHDLAAKAVGEKTTNIQCQGPSQMYFEGVT